MFTIQIDATFIFWRLLLAIAAAVLAFFCLSTLDTALCVVASALLFYSSVAPREDEEEDDHADRA